MKTLRRVLFGELFLLLGVAVAALVVLAWVALTRGAEAQARVRVASSLGQFERALTERMGELERLNGAVAALWANGTLDPAKDRATYALLLPLVEGRSMVTGLNLVGADGRAFGMGRLQQGWGGRSILKEGADFKSGPILGDEAGEVRNNMALARRAMDFRERPWYRFGEGLHEARWTAPYIFSGRLAGTPGLSCVAPVRDRQGRLLGVVSLDVVLEDLAAVVHDLLPTRGATLTVLDTDGRILLPPAQAPFLAASERRGAFLQSVGGIRLPQVARLHAQAAGQLQASADLDGHLGRLHRFGEAAGLGWELVLMVPRKDVTADPHRRALVVGALGLLSTVLLVIQGMRLVRRFTLPLGILEREAEAMGDHQPVRLPGTEIREIRALGLALARAKEAVQEREQLQEQLRQSQKLELIGLLAGGIAHDVNNQLTAIQGQIELGLEKLGEEHRAARHFMRATEAAKYCGETTKALLSFSRPSQSELRPVDLNSTVREGLLLLERVIDRRVRLEVSLEEGMPPVMGDKVQLQQVLVNLVVNAKDALPAGGTIQVATGLGREGVYMEVRDNGLGMGEDTKAHIFEPFFTTKAVGQGTGLGLAMVQGIVQAHQGRIEVDSEWGRGATFRVHLPVARGAVAESEPPSAHAPVYFPGLRVLVVEDEPTIQATLVELLESRGALVSTAGDGVEAWERMRGREFDLVVSDQLMPRMTGVELLAQLRAKWPDLPVILASGRGLEGMEEDLSHDPQLRLLAKPYPLARFLKLVAELVRGR